MSSKLVEDVIIAHRLVVPLCFFVRCWTALMAESVVYCDSATIIMLRLLLHLGQDPFNLGLTHPYWALLSFGHLLRNLVQRIGLCCVTSLLTLSPDS